MILDEAVSALDVSVRNEILALLDELKRERGLTYLFISHDMGAVAQLASEVAVLYLGKVVEAGAAEAVIRRPAHPYTPRADRGRSRYPYSETAGRIRDWRN